jgi:hypothetical protein
VSRPWNEGAGVDGFPGQGEADNATVRRLVRLRMRERREKTSRTLAWCA